jgi:hypothetical protein
MMAATENFIRYFVALIDITYDYLLALGNHDAIYGSSVMSST